MKLSKFKLRVKHNAGEASREAVILAHGSLVAVLWYKKFAKSKAMPQIIEKNGKPYEVSSGSKAYKRAMSVSRGKKLKKKMQEQLEKKDEKACKDAEKFFDQCVLLEEDVYVV